MKNCIVAQSGGPTVAINASLAGIVSSVMKSGEYGTIFGSVNGITGIIEHRIMNLSEVCEDEETIDILKTSPSMYLGSCRYKLPSYEQDKEIYVKIFQTFEQFNIGAFFYIGGNDSMDTVYKLSQYAKNINSDVRIIGVPKTIDNDLCATDHTPGFGSAAKYVATSMLEISHDTYIYNLKSVTIVEVMGRDAGWLTAATVLARNEYSEAPHLIYLPEVTFDCVQFIEDLRKLLKTKDSVIVAVSEGIRNYDGEYISANSKTTDQFGHSQLSGVGKYLEMLVKEELGVKVRSIELSVLQRCAAHLASDTDIEEAFTLGQMAVDYSLDHMTGVMVTMKRISNEPYQITYGYAPIEGIANEAKSVPLQWINEAGNDVTLEMIEYLKPLIHGETIVQYHKGLPRYMNVEHLFR